jgi:hypothetical protein
MLKPRVDAGTCGLGPGFRPDTDNPHGGSEPGAISTVPYARGSHRRRTDDTALWRILVVYTLSCLPRYFNLSRVVMRGTSRARRETCPSPSGITSHGSRGDLSGSLSWPTISQNSSRRSRWRSLLVVILAHAPSWWPTHSVHLSRLCQHSSLTRMLMAEWGFFFRVSLS